MADERASTEEEPDVEAHGTSGNDVVEGTSGGLHEEEPDVEAHGTSGNDVVEGTSGGLHEDDSDDVEAHVFAQGFSGGFQGEFKDGTSGG